MIRDELIAAALGLPGAVEDYPFGDDLLTVKVGRHDGSSVKGTRRSWRE